MYKINNNELNCVQFKFGTQNIFDVKQQNISIFNCLNYMFSNSFKIYQDLITCNKAKPKITYV